MHLAVWYGLNREQIPERGARLTRRDDREYREYWRRSDAASRDARARTVSLDGRIGPRASGWDTAMKRSLQQGGSMSRRKSPIRYAVVGLGHIAQVAVLPAFAHAARNSRLTALVSDDPVKLKTLARRYRVKATYSYAQYKECLQHVDAVYIALPNSMHAEYTIQAE